jgi:predicted nucleotidyltransferase component of viral defense system
VLEDRKETVPVTTFQAKVAKLLSANKSHDSYLAGGAALHFEPNSIRYSQDLDYFHDTDQRVAESFALDREVLINNQIKVEVQMHQPGYIRALVRSDIDSTKIEWAHDSAWRFMPTYFIEDRGYVLHPVDLAVNKVLALAGRDEPRDYLDVLHAHDTILPLAGLIWAACGKDPGFTPDSLLELIQRKGKYREEDFRRLHLNFEINLVSFKNKWILMLKNARKAIDDLPYDEVGCMYYDTNNQKFILPPTKRSKAIVPHFATIGGILPRIIES